MREPPPLTCQNFNSRSPCGERPPLRALSSDSLIFQLTLPVWGATFPNDGLSKAIAFQLTLPVWGATFPAVSTEASPTISTHAPRVGSDRLSCL